MYRIAKTFTFSASHQIEGLPEGHKCRRLHGHNYTAEFILEGEATNEVGMIRDYGDLDAMKPWIERLDHHHLNDLLAHTTAEEIAYYLWDCARHSGISEIAAVRVSEGPTTWAEYRP